MRLVNPHGRQAWINRVVDYTLNGGKMHRGMLVPRIVEQIGPEARLSPRGAFADARGNRTACVGGLLANRCAVLFSGECSRWVSRGLAYGTAHAAGVHSRLGDRNPPGILPRVSADAARLRYLITLRIGLQRTQCLF